MPWHIEPIHEADIPGFHATLDAVAQERRYLALMEAPPLERVRSFVLDNLKTGNPQFVVLANQQIVGWCDVVRITHGSMQHGGTLGIGLLPAWRGRGIGRQLILRTLAAAWEAEFKRVELNVRLDNTTAIHLYRKLGFEEEGRRQSALYVDEHFHDLLLMALLHPTLRPPSNPPGLP